MNLLKTVVDAVRKRIALIRAVGFSLNFNNKDFKTAVIAILAICFLAWLLIGCSMAPDNRPRVKAGLAIELDKQVFGRNPVGWAGFEYTVPDRYLPFFARTGDLVVGFEHLSSAPDQHDRTDANMLTFTYEHALGRNQALQVCTPYEELVDARKRIRDLEEQLRRSMRRNMSVVADESPSALP